MRQATLNKVDKNSRIKIVENTVQKMRSQMEKDQKMVDKKIHKSNEFMLGLIETQTNIALKKLNTDQNKAIKKAQAFN